MPLKKWWVWVDDLTDFTKFRWVKQCFLPNFSQVMAHWESDMVGAMEKMDKDASSPEAAATRPPQATPRDVGSMSRHLCHPSVPVCLGREALTDSGLSDSIQFTKSS